MYLAQKKITGNPVTSPLFGKKKDLLHSIRTRHFANASYGTHLENHCCFINRLTIFLQLKTGTLRNKGHYQIYKKIIFAKKLKVKLVG